MKSLRLLLYPFALLYGAITWIRNKAFDLGILKSQSFDVETLVIGNLNTGGTGKTPHTAYFIRQNQGRKVAVISRGYGRKSKGFHLVGTGDSPEQSGDEPLLLKKTFPHIPVAVCEDRVIAVPELLAHYPETELIIFDDAFQHRYLKADTYILLSTYNDLFCQDHLLPAGNLREARSGYRRAKHIIVTKCPPHISQEEMDGIRKRIKPGNRKLSFSRNIMSTPRNLEGEEASIALFPEKKLLIFSAIAHGDQWAAPLRKGFKEVLPSLTYPDHHLFTRRDIDLLLKKVEKAGLQDTVVLTTAKDAMRLSKFTRELADIAINYIDVEVEMLAEMPAQ